MAEILDQKEIDDLIRAIDAECSEEDFVDNPKISGKRIKIYDFARPDVFSKDNIISLSMIHEVFSRLMTTGLSSKLQKMVHFHVASVDQLTTEEFIRSLPTPTSLAIINMDPLKGNAVMEIDPAITFSILESLMGGAGECDGKYQHELTKIETSIMEDIFVRTLSDMRESFSSIIDLRPRIGQLETNPQFCYVVPPQEMGILVTIEAKVNNVEGMINIYYPRETLKDIMPKLSYQSFYPKYKKEKPLKKVNVIKIRVPIVAELGRKIMTFKEIKDIGVNQEFIFTKNDLLLRTKNDIKISNYSFEEDNKIKLRNIRKEKMTENKVNLDYEIGDTNKIKIQMIAELGRKELCLGEVQALEEGTIIELDSMAGEPVNLFANNVLVAKGEVVVYEDHFAVRVVETL